MNKLLSGVLALGFMSGCASLGESMSNAAVNSAGDVTGHAVSSAGDRATDAAIDKASTSHNDESQPAAQKPSTRLEADDVLVKDGDTFVVGKVLGQPAGDGTATVLLIADGRKLSTKDIVRVRQASKTEAKLGADVYYTQDEDVRHGRWANGAITDTKNLGSNHIDVAGARDLDFAGQVAVVR